MNKRWFNRDNRPLIESSLLFCAFFLPGYLWQNSPETTYIDYNNPAFHLAYHINVLPKLLLTLYLLHIDTDINRQVWRQNFGFRAPRLKDMTDAFLALLLLLAGLLPLGWLLRYLFAIENQLRIVAPTAAGLPLLLLMLLLVGYWEEFFFRSYLINRLRQAKVSLTNATLFSALLFAAGHLYQGAAAFVLSFLIAIYFSYLFFRRRSLHVNALTHALYDLFIILLIVSQQ